MNTITPIALFTPAVLDFREKFRLNPSVQLSVQLLAEEAKELVEASDALTVSFSVENMEAFLKEAADLYYVLIGFVLSADEYLAKHDVPSVLEVDDLEALEERLPEASDILEKAAAAFLTQDILIEAFGRVHASNLSKLGEDGQPIFNEDGKVMKGPNYQPPYLTDLAQEAINRFTLFALLHEQGLMLAS